MPRTAAAPAPTKPVLPVRSRRKDIDTDNENVGQDAPRRMKSTGPAKESLEPALVQPVEQVSQAKAEALAFMEEEITVIVHQSTSPTDEPIVEVWNDGTPQRFGRGQEQTVKRKYVEVLARAKKTGYSQTRDRPTDDYFNVPHTALKYPFSVIEDRNPKGAAWLRSVLSQA